MEKNYVLSESQRAELVIVLGELQGKISYNYIKMLSELQEVVLNPAPEQGKKGKGGK
jgi:translation initiation factor IF-1